MTNAPNAIEYTRIITLNFFSSNKPYNPAKPPTIMPIAKYGIITKAPWYFKGSMSGPITVEMQTPRHPNKLESEIISLNKYKLCFLFVLTDHKIGAKAATKAPIKTPCKSTSL